MFRRFSFLVCRPGRWASYAQRINTLLRLDPSRGLWNVQAPACLSLSKTPPCLGLLLTSHDVPSIEPVARTFKIEAWFSTPLPMTPFPSWRLPTGMLTEPDFRCVQHFDASVESVAINNNMLGTCRVTSGSRLLYPSWYTDDHPPITKQVTYPR